MPDRAAQRRGKDDTGSDSMSSDNPARQGEGGHKIRPKHAVKHRLQHRVPSTRALGNMKGADAKAKRHSRELLLDGGDISPTNTGRRTASEDLIISGKSSKSSKSGEWVEEEDPLERLKRVADEKEREGALSREGSHTNLAGLRDKKTTGGMRRNRSAVEMAKRRLASHGGSAMKKSASHTSIHKQGRTNVHFDLGHKQDNGDDDDGWTEASGSASPNLSRSGSVAGQHSGRNSARGVNSANNSKAPSASTSPNASRTESRDWTTASTSRRSSQSNGSQANATQQARHPDAAQITNRLLQRVPSHSVAPQMSTVIATALPTSNLQAAQSHTNSDGGRSSGTATPYDAPQDLISRFKSSGSATPNDSPSPFHSHLGTPQHQARQGQRQEQNQNQTSNPQPQSQNPKPALDNNRRAKSMSNLSQPPPPTEEEADRPLQPRSRKSSGAGAGAGSAYFPTPALQSRTQQKLWLQRASSDIESAAPTAAAVGLGLANLGIRGKGGVQPLLGSVSVMAGPDGPDLGDPRVKLVLERTGSAYRAVRRFMDPVGRSLLRLQEIPGTNIGTRIPEKKGGNGGAGGKGGRTKSEGGQGQKSGHGLSQSLKDAGESVAGMLGRNSSEGARGGSAPRSFEDNGVGGDGREEEDETLAILRSMWEQRPERE